MDIEALEQRDLKKKQRAVAGLFLLAVGLAGVFAYWMGAFGVGPSKHVFVNYDFAGGIERGSPVRLAGIKVGRVADIHFTSEPTQLTLKVEVNREAFKQVTDDSQFYVNLAGLIGERYVEIVPGKGSTVASEHVFRGVDPPRIDQLLSQGYGIFGDLRAFFSENKSDLKEMFATLNDLYKNLAKVMLSVTPDQRKQISGLLANFSAMSSDLRTMVASLSAGTQFVEENKGREAWLELRGLLDKANGIDLQDIRRLMLEDGVKVNFSTKKIPEGLPK